MRVIKLKIEIRYIEYKKGEGERIEMKGREMERL